MLSLIFKGFFSLKILIFSVLFICILVLLHFGNKRKRYCKLLPSRKTRFINILGDLSDFKYSKTRFNGYSIIAALTQYGSGIYNLFKNEKLFVYWVGYLPFVVLIAPEAVEEVLKSTTVIKKAWFYKLIHCWLRTGLFTSDGNKWKSRRKLLTPVYHLTVLNDFLPSIHEKSMELVKKFHGETSKDFTDIVTPINLLVIDIVSKIILGIDMKAQENGQTEYSKAVKKVTDGIIQRILNFWCWFDCTYFLTKGRNVKNHLQFLHQFTLTVIQDKKRQMQNKIREGISCSQPKTLIDMLLEHHLQTKELTEEDIREEIDTFTFAAYDTTTTALVWSLYLLGLYEQVQIKIQKELDLIFGNNTERPVTIDDLKDMTYLECAIKESIRLYPPVPFFGRQAETDINISGYPIPKGSSIFIASFLIHRDENIYPNPEVFDPERFNPENSAKRHSSAFIPFSGGLRICIGRKLAMMDIKVVLANIFRNFTIKSLDHRDKILPSAEIILRPTGPIRIKIVSRKPEHVS